MIIAGLDLETTGLLAPEERIIECHISLYDWDGTDGVFTESNTWRIDPKRNIGVKAFAVHGISNDDLIGCPTFEVAGHDIAKYLNKADLVVWHNGDEFDGPFLIKEWERVGCDIPDLIPIDTMTNGRWATAMGSVPNLGALCFACGVDYDSDKAHAADYDVKVMMECFFFGVKAGFFNLPQVYSSDF